MPISLKQDVMGMGRMEMEVSGLMPVLCGCVCGCVYTLAWFMPLYVLCVYMLISVGFMSLCVCMFILSLCACVCMLTSVWFMPLRVCEPDLSYLFCALCV